MKRKIAGIMLSFICSAAFAQQENKGVFSSPVIPGPNGVFVFATDTARHAGNLGGSQVHSIYREDKRGSGFKKITDISFPGSTSALEKKMGKDLLQEILQKRRIPSSEALYSLLRAGRFDTLGVYMSSTPVMVALGLLYIDQQVTKADPQISYRLDLSQNGNTRVVYQINLGEILYSPMPVFKKYKTLITDSAALVTWYSIRDQADYATIFSNAGTNKENQYGPGTRQLVYQRRDTIFLTYSTVTIPGSKLNLFIRPEDIAGNRGLPSDTIHLLALSFNNTLSISNLTATDTLGSVWLAWDSLPNKAWCSGIQVLKSRSGAGDYVVIDTLPITATRYRDRRGISGNVYYYQLRPLLFDLPQRGHSTPALVSVRTKKVRDKIAAPQGLHISLTAKNDFRLAWQPNGDLDIFAYYILRGTSAKNMRVISPAIKDTTFIDSLNSLNSGITYLYSVVALNMDVIWSDTSAPIAVQSPRATLIAAPAGIQARATALGILLNWNDASLADPSVVGYMIYRRKKGETYFKAVNNKPVTGTYYTDSSALDPAIYEYGCSSVDGWNHVSILSPLSAVNLSGGKSGGAFGLNPPADFLLRNLPAGIEIRVPETASPANSATAARYILYRRAVTEKTARKIGELMAGNLAYTDKQVIKDQLYVYTVSTQLAAAESNRTGEKSIRRK